MLLLGIEAEVAKEVRFAVHETQFKGGMFHGLIETTMGQHDPELLHRLKRVGQSGPSQSPAYALVPPSDALPSYPAGHSFYIGVMLFGDAALDWRRALDCLILASHRGLSHRRIPFRITGVTLSHPSAGSQVLAESNRLDMASLAHTTIELPQSGDAEGVTFNLLSPTLIDSEKRRSQELGHPDHPPMPLTLTSIVSSLKRRVQSCEPLLAQAFQFNGSEWLAAEQAIRACRLPSSHNVRWAKWRYASQHTQGGAELRAILGQISFEGPIPAPVVALLDVGQWLAMGQKCTLGQGWYRIDIKESTP